ncbi:rapid alkalinization factor 23-like [Phragmites australis]|uniref:rapid alkalinization factor 23-like n=1 Tax=Phragmites australis TaxID=29695 RepID=UPI002D777DD1|nr:rapid alkalinization factor 23-like [Phragmites australis]
MAPTSKLILLSRAWAAASLLLLLLLLFQGRGGHCISLGMEMEMEMDSEAHRRLLWEATTGRRYISYDALRGDVVPCSRPGVPYYNCRIMTTANPYTRGCESITRCRDDAEP